MDVLIVSNRTNGKECYVKRSWNLSWFIRIYFCVLSLVKQRSLSVIDWLLCFHFKLSDAIRGDDFVTKNRFWFWRMKTNVIANGNSGDQHISFLLRSMILFFNSWNCRYWWVFPWSLSKQRNLYRPYQRVPLQLCSWI